MERMEQWTIDLRNSVMQGERLAEDFGGNASEIDAVCKEYPMRIPRYYYNLIQQKGDPIWMQSVPSIHELQDLVKKIALKEKIEESREFASDVQKSLYSSLAAKTPAIRDRGVKKAPFIVLIGANMPSILAEISFVSNPADERKLRTPAYRQKIAEALYKGVARYVNGLSGVKVANTKGNDKGGD